MHLLAVSDESSPCNESWHTKEKGVCKCVFGICFFGNILSFDSVFFLSGVLFDPYALRTTTAIIAIADLTSSTMYILNSILHIVFINLTNTKVIGHIMGAERISRGNNSSRACES